jgi:hypothetical protein
MQVPMTVKDSLTIISERKKKFANFDKWLDSLDWLDRFDEILDENEDVKPIRMPYSGAELNTSKQWK